MDDISIIIVSYNVKSLLLACISSINKFCSVPEIIVVDNNSTDGSIDELTEQYPEIIVIANKRNVGFSAANNQGIEIAKRNKILLLNPDTELKSPMTGLLEYLNSHEEISILAPKLLNADSSLQVSCWKFPTVWNIIVESLFLNRFFNLSQYPLDNFKNKFKTDFASGAALLFRKELVHTIGPLDVNLFWMDDVDFCYRAQAVGAVLYFPETEIFHFTKSNKAKNFKIIIHNQLISKLKFLKKHKGAGVAAFASCFIFIHIVSRATVFFVLTPFNKEFKGKFAAYMFALQKFISYIFNKHTIT